jgi:protease II
VLALILAAVCCPPAGATPPTDLQITGVPAIPDDLQHTIDKYEAAQSNFFMGWDPTAPYMLVSSTDDGMQQLHVQLAPNGDTRLPTLFPGVVTSGSFMPKTGDLVIFAADHAGDEFYQLYSLNAKTGNTQMITDGQSLNSETIYDHTGQQIAYRSTAVDPKHGDIYVMDPHVLHSDHMVMKIDDGGWMLQDWAHDGQHIVVSHDYGLGMGYLWRINAATGETKLLTEQRETQQCYLAARYTPKDDGLWVIQADQDARLFINWLSLTPSAVQPKIPVFGGDVHELELSPDGSYLAYIVETDNIDQLHVFNTVTGVEEPAAGLPEGMIGRVRWNGDGTQIGFCLGGTGAPMQACSYSVVDHKMVQWTFPTVDAPAPKSVKAELISIHSFDGLAISGYLYRPDPAKFPGPRPVIIDIHGGPESEYLPEYSSEVNYDLNELGVAVLFPNVRGSTGFGERFADLDNGFRREDSVKDIGAFLDWIPTDRGLDSTRVAVQGGSYGGYMVLASLYHYSNRLRCGCDEMGITDFVTFLHNTKIYRQASRRYEYGDERYPDMCKFLESISPLNHVAEIGDPVMIAAGKNDPRVPESESDQMVTALRAKNNIVWYILGESEGHGFHRTPDVRYTFAAQSLFFQTYLLPKQRVTPLLPQAAAAATPAPAAAPAESSHGYD